MLFFIICIMGWSNLELHYSYIINTHSLTHTLTLPLAHEWPLSPPSHPSSPPLGSVRDGASWRLMVSSWVISAGHAWNFSADSIIKRRRLCSVLGEYPTSLDRPSVREYRSAPLLGQPAQDEADADTRTDAGMLWFLHVLLLKSDAEETSIYKNILTLLVYT